MERTAYDMTLPEALEVARTPSECEESDVLAALGILAQAYRDTRTIADDAERRAGAAQTDGAALTMAKPTELLGELAAAQEAREQLRTSLADEIREHRAARVRVAELEQLRTDVRATLALMASGAITEAGVRQRLESALVRGGR